MSEEKETIVLLDVHAIIHRAYHALPDFTSSTGEPTGALYGVSSMLLKIIKDLKPDRVIACYDLPKPTFRHDVYKEYKAGRPKTDDDLVSQIKKSYEIFKAFNIPVYEKEGFEADDIIGTLAEKVSQKKDKKVIIASGDMDTLQLVKGSDVSVYTLRKGITDTIIYDEGKVKERFGFKPDLLPDYKGLRGDPSDNIVGIRGIGEKTATELIKEFGTIENVYNILRKDRNIFLRKGFKERIIKLLEEGKEDALFSKELATIRIDAPIVLEDENGTRLDKIKKEDVISLFNELGFRSLVVRFKEIFEVRPDQKTQEGKNMSDKKINELGIALWLLDSNITNPTEEDILGFTHATSQEEAEKTLLKRLKKEELLGVFENIEIPLIPIILKMENRGIKIDVIFLKELSKRYHLKLKGLENNIWKYAGSEFNINSPKQLGEILFDKLKIKPARIKKTSTGARSTRASELEKMRGEHEIIDKILEYREYQKLLSTYIDNIPKMLGSDGRLHTKLIQTGTTTGRIASQNPNLQNIPIKTELGRKIRNAFVADKGFMMLSFDYSQVELRVAALLSGDKKLIEIFEEGKDVHSATASEIFKVPIQEVNSEMRRIAKVINFGILYGMGINALKQNLNSTREEAAKFYDKYFDSFKGLAVYLEEVKKNARKTGYTKTYYGRKRYFPGLNSPLEYIRAQDERMAINAPIQGTATADIIKIAMNKVDKRLRKEKLPEEVRMLLQVHDELLFEVKKEKLNHVIIIIKEEMEGVLKEKVPFIVDVSSGYNWGEMKRIS